MARRAVQRSCSHHRVVALLALPGWRAGRSFLGSLPKGYREGAVGVGLFGLGGSSDLGWHQVFGVETGIDALLSPTHLLLFAGGLLILTNPLRARWSSGPLGTADRWLATGSAILAAALASFALIYTSAFAMPRPVETFIRLPKDHPAHEATELPVVAGLASYLVTTVVLVVPLLFLLQHRSLPVGGVTLLTAALAGLSVAVADFSTVATVSAVGAVGGGLLADLLVARTALTSQWWTLPATGAIVVLVVWSGQLVGLALAAGLGWPVELWSGVVLLSAAMAGILGLLGETSRVTGTGQFPA